MFKSVHFMKMLSLLCICPVYKLEYAFSYEYDLSSVGLFALYYKRVQASSDSNNYNIDTHFSSSSSQISPSHVINENTIHSLHGSMYPCRMIMLDTHSSS
mmetsp:Transcript_20906/g.31185  ORF Transcript_20906/g.31185 Transcript_20906/m.31185 type:complete len:100 (+) Transcript_20906:2120-2419(+)